ncbi:hypothetical protein EGW08_019389, partial [Elysia chlorotica]
QATVELLKTLKWEENILIIYSDDEYGRNGYEQLLQAAYYRGICFSKAVAIDPTDLTKDLAKDALAALGTQSYNAGVLMMSFVNGKKVFEAIEEIQTLHSTQWIVSDFDITSDYSSLIRSRGMMLVTPSSPQLDDFKNFFAQEESNINPSAHTENPWFIDWYEKKYSCSIRNANSGPPCTARSVADLRAAFVQSPFAVPTMKAIAVYIEAVRQRCTTGVACLNQLLSINPSDFHETLKNLDVTFPANYPIVGLRGERVKFDANGDLEVTKCDVYNHRRTLNGVSSLYQKIGEYQNNVLTLNTNPTLYDNGRTQSLNSIPEFLCPLCSNCLKPQVSTVLRYNPGDVVIASLASGHTSGRFPFTCGDGDLPRLAALVAAEWATSQYKTQNAARLQQVALGSLVVDICPDALVASRFLMDLLGGNNRLMGASNNIISADNIYGFVDHTDGDQASIISPILASLKIPEVQTDSVHLMGDADSFTMLGGVNDTYTVQAVPNDNMLHEAIASVLLRLGWKYVQVATHGTGVYNQASLDFKRTAG